MLDERQQHALDRRRKHLTMARLVKQQNASLPGWGIKAICRLGQIAKEPGVYPITLIVNDDGTRELMTESGKVEALGR